MQQQQQHPQVLSPLASSAVRHAMQHENTATDDYPTLPTTCKCLSFMNRNNKSGDNSGKHGSKKEKKENSDMAAKASHQSLLAKMTKLLRTKGATRRPEKCEKCGERSHTCLPNASFVSNRTHFLCLSCRVTGSMMKNMYSQLSRNLSLRESRRTTTTTTTTSSNASDDKESGLHRPTLQGNESGYETGTSLDSCSNGRQTPDSIMSTDSAGQQTTVPTATTTTTDVRVPVAGMDSDLASKDSGKADVFGGAFTSEMDHLQTLSLKHRCSRLGGIQQQQPQQQKCRVYTRPHAAASKTAQDAQQPVASNVLMQNYDGYLEIRAPNSEGVKYVFRQRESCEQVEAAEKRQSLEDSLKVCYRCKRPSQVAFRAPFQRGWLCEDCMDDLL